MARRVPEERIGAARNRAAAIPGALQLVPASAHPAGGVFGLDHRSVCADRRRPIRRAAGACSSRSRSGPNDEDAAARKILTIAHAACLSTAGHRRRSRRVRSSCTSRAHNERRRVRRGDRDWRWRPCWSVRSSSSASNATRRRRAGTRLSHHRSGAGLAPVVLSCGAAFRTTNCSMWRSRESCTSRRCSNARCGGCWPTSVRNRWSPTSPTQWLYLRNLDSITPDMRLFPDFDDNLRQAFRQETELLLREHPARGPQRARPAARPTTRSSTNGSRSTTEFRTSTAAASAASSSTTTASAAGCCGRAAFCTVTSYATRTSPVIRGKWVLENLLGIAAAAAAAECAGAEGQHRSRQACRPRAAGRASRNAACAQLPRPDGSGRLRAGELRRGRPLAQRRGRRADRRVRRRFPTAASSTDVAGLEQALLARPDLFVAHADREAADLCARTRRRVLRRAGHPQDRARRAARRTIASRR